jgi:hypothetical protein
LPWGSRAIVRDRLILRQKLKIGINTQQRQGCIADLEEWKKRCGTRQEDYQAVSRLKFKGREERFMGCIRSHY